MKTTLPLLLLLLATTALAEEPVRFPFSPFEGAKEGDWARYSWELKDGEDHHDGTWIWSVGRVTSESLSVKKCFQLNVLINPRDLHSETPRFAVDERPALADIFNFSRASKVENLATTDEKRKVGDEDLDCKKLRFTVTDAHSKDDYTVWLSPRVRGIGLVAFTQEIHIPGQNVRRETAEIEAYANADDRDARLPIDVFKDTREGDWTLLRTSWTDWKVVTWRVESADEKNVRLACGKRTVTIDRSRPPTVLELFGIPCAQHGLVVRDETFTHEGRTFPCKRVDGWNIDGPLRIRICPDVKGPGIVEVDASDGGVLFYLSVLGFGSKDKTEWGFNEKGFKNR